MNKRELLLIALLVIIIILLFYGIYKINSEGGKCIQQPLIYGAEQYAKQGGDDGIFCTCSFYSPKYKGFYFDKNGVILK